MSRILQHLHERCTLPCVARVLQAMAYFLETNISISWQWDPRLRECLCAWVTAVHALL